ncbi:hypothetical protein Tco_0961570 [Tanacetum coccineum]
MRQRRWIGLFSDYNCEIRYHLGKANVVVDALSRKEMVKPRRILAMCMTIQSGVKDKIWVAQMEASKLENAPAKMLQGLDQQIEKKEDGAIRKDYNMDRLARIYINEKALGTRLDMSTAYHPQTDGQKEVGILIFLWRSFPITIVNTQALDVLYLRHYMEGNERLKAARDRQKSYADNRCKRLEFSVGDQVLLKVPPWKGVVHFGKKGKLAPRYVGPFEIIEWIDHVAYRLRLPHELSSVHDTFHVSNLKKCLADAKLHVPLDEIRIDKTLHFVEEPVEIIDREVKRLKCSKIPIVKIRWNSNRGPKFTWELEDHMKTKYLHLFSEQASSDSTSQISGQNFPNGGIL